MNLDCCNNCVHKSRSDRYCSKLKKVIPLPSEDICSSHRTSWYD